MRSHNGNCSRSISRRAFCGAALATLASLGAPHLVTAEDALEFNLAEVERPRVLHAARNYLKQKPVPITSFSSPRSVGGKHDYFSEGDYWWPDPKDPSGPYIQRDGMSNPDNFIAHRHALIQLGVQVPALTAAWLLTSDKRYADHAAQHLRSWFLNPDTLMNPNLQYAQAIHGRTSGRGTGIIDTIHLVEVARSVPALAKAKSLSPAEFRGVKKWFSDYLNWMTTSKNGQEEREAKNNHGTWWVTQAAEFANLTGNNEVTTYCAERFKTVLIARQITNDGSMPEELRRTKPYNYCLFNLSGLATICQTLKGDDLFHFSLPDGRGFAKAMAWMFPYIADKSKWPYKSDVEYFQYWPIRQPDLLFAGIAFSNREYLARWKNLSSEPDVEEIIRNNPIRQPLLWIETAS